MDSLDIQYWETIGEQWNREHPDRLWRDYGDAVNRAWLARWLPARSGLRILKTDVFDEAYGGGIYPLLAERESTVVGMDVASAVVRTAHMRNPTLPVVRADARGLPFAEAVFDVVVSNSTLDHFHTAAEIITSLREIHRVLRPGGRLLLTLDNPLNPAVGLRNKLSFAALNRLGLVPYYVGVTMGPRPLRTALDQCGFDVVETDAILHCVRVFAVRLCRMVARWGSPNLQRSFLRALRLSEGLRHSPLRFLTGNYVAVVATKPPRLQQP